MDLRKLKTILDLFERSDIDEMEISEGEENLRLVKSSRGAPQPQTQAPQMQQPLASPVASPAVPITVQQQIPPPPQQPAAAVQQPADDAENLVNLVAPMVGTFYTKPGEDEKPFVAVGDHVTEGDTVCIIEAMKLFNNVKAPVSGKVVKIVAENEQPVGYGDVLMSFRPDA